MGFEFDPHKSEINKKTHGIEFVAAPDFGTTCTDYGDRVE